MEKKVLKKKTTSGLSKHSNNTQTRRFSAKTREPPPNTGLVLKCEIHKMDSVGKYSFWATGSSSSCETDHDYSWELLHNA
jgi:hypothetical protein